jgi:hypothetical protein
MFKTFLSVPGPVKGLELYTQAAVNHQSSGPCHYTCSVLRVPICNRNTVVGQEKSFSSAVYEDINTYTIL